MNTKKTVREWREELSKHGHTKQHGVLLVFPGQMVTAELVQTRTRWAVDSEHKKTKMRERRYFTDRKEAISYAFAMSGILPFTF